MIEIVQSSARIDFWIASMLIIYLSCIHKKLYQTNFYKEDSLSEFVKMIK